MSNNIKTTKTPSSWKVGAIFGLIYGILLILLWFSVRSSGLDGGLHYAISYLNQIGLALVLIIGSILIFKKPNWGAYLLFMAGWIVLFSISAYTIASFYNSVLKNNLMVLTNWETVSVSIRSFIALFWIVTYWRPYPKPARKKQKLAFLPFFALVLGVYLWCIDFRIFSDMNKNFFTTIAHGQFLLDVCLISPLYIIMGIGLVKNNNWAWNIALGLVGYQIYIGLVRVIAMPIDGVLIVPYMIFSILSIIFSILVIQNTARKECDLVSG